MEKKNNTEIDSLFKELNDTYVEKSKESSTICRQIVFALIAIVWAMVYINGTANWKNEAGCVLALLVIYCFFDVLQYLTIVILYRNHYNKIKELLEEGVDFSLIASQEKEKRGKLNNTSFCFFIAKIIVLFLSVIGIIYMIL